MNRPALAPTLSLLLILPGCTDHEATRIARSRATHEAVVAIVAAGTSIASARPAEFHRAEFSRAEFSRAEFSRAEFDTAEIQTATIATGAAAPGTSVVGMYDIDIEATLQHAGFLGYLIESKVLGSTLELRADGTYAGMKNGTPETTGTWSFEDGRIQMKQTHEGNEPVEGRGEGTTRNGMLTVKTLKSGLSITLVFNRR